MARHRKLYLPLVLFSGLFLLAGCYNGPAVSGTFDRSYSVTGPIRVELANASGDVDIIGSGDGKVHVHGEVRASGFGSDTPQRRLDETVSNPPSNNAATPFASEKNSLTCATSASPTPFRCHATRKSVPLSLP